MTRSKLLATVTLLTAGFLGTASAQTTLPHNAHGSTVLIRDLPVSPAALTVIEHPYPCDSCGHGGLHDCPVVWLRPWKCEDLEMKPVEPSKHYCGCGIHGWLD